VHNGLQVSQVANELSATDRADHTLPKPCHPCRVLSKAGSMRSLTRSESAYPNSPELISCLCCQTSMWLVRCRTYQLIRTPRSKCLSGFIRARNINCSKCCRRSVRNTRYGSSNDTSPSRSTSLNTNPKKFCFRRLPTNSFLPLAAGTSQKRSPKSACTFWALWHQGP
jgi:hypothetical protein